MKTFYKKVKKTNFEYTIMLCFIFIIEDNTDF